MKEYIMRYHAGLLTRMGAIECLYNKTGEAVTETLSNPSLSLVFFREHGKDPKINTVCIIETKEDHDKYCFVNKEVKDDDSPKAKHFAYIVKKINTENLPKFESEQYGRNVIEVNFDDVDASGAVEIIEEQGPPTFHEAPQDGNGHANHYNKLTEQEKLVADTTSHNSIITLNLADTNIYLNPPKIVKAGLLHRLFCCYSKDAAEKSRNLLSDDVELSDGKKLISKS